MDTKRILNLVREVYETNSFIPLHAPTFSGQEMEFVGNTIESTFVSSVGEYVNEFESQLEQFTGSRKIVATVNGTAALHASLYLSGVGRGDVVITQALTFVATCNAIKYLGAEPVFVDVSKVSLGLCPKALERFLDENAFYDEKTKQSRLIHTKQRIAAVLPMHTFGHPVELDELLDVCQRWNLTMIEDAAESLGSYYKGTHTGNHGEFSALSFNGNKVITTGGGGAVMCKSEQLGLKMKHITTTAKRPHAFEFFHDEIAFNYRMPNLNAALGCAQMESLPGMLYAKRKLSEIYRDFFASEDYLFVDEPSYAKSNFWLNAILCPNEKARDELLTISNEAGVMTRPIWQLMTKLPMFINAIRGDLVNSEYFEKHLVNIPSTPPKGLLMEFSSNA